MKTIYQIKSLGATIVLNDKKEFQGEQKTIKLTNKAKIDTIGKVDRVFDNMLRTAQIERKKESKQQFFNKHKKQ